MSEDVNVKKAVKKLVSYDKFSYINLLSLVSVNKQSGAKHVLFALMLNLNRICSLRLIKMGGL